MPDYTKPPLSYYTPPGIVRVSPEAVKMARDLDYTVRRLPNVRDPLVAFDWSTRRSTRAGPDAPEVEHGPGLVLGAGERSDAPSEAIQTVDGLAFTVMIPREVYERSRERLIDVDKADVTRLILR